MSLAEPSSGRNRPVYFSTSSTYRPGIFSSRLAYGLATAAGMSRSPVSLGGRPCHEVVLGVVFSRAGVARLAVVTGAGEDGRVFDVRVVDEVGREACRVGERAHRPGPRIKQVLDHQDFLAGEKEDDLKLLAVLGCIRSCLAGKRHELR